MSRVPEWKLVGCALIVLAIVTLVGGSYLLSSEQIYSNPMLVGVISLMVIAIILAVFVYFWRFKE